MADKFINVNQLKEKIVSEQKNNANMGMSVIYDYFLKIIDDTPIANVRPKIKIKDYRRNMRQRRYQITSVSPCCIYYSKKPVKRLKDEVKEVSRMKCCNTCKYGVISEFLEKHGESCCIICARMSKPLKGRIYLHNKDDKCRSYEADVINKLISGELNK